MIREQEGEPICEIEEFMELRKNKKAFEQFCENILPCVVGKKYWDKRVDSVCMSRVATDTDEAWALLVMENSWEAWKQLAGSPNGKLPEDAVRKRTKWTNTGSQQSRSEGWGERGIGRFNELTKMVIEDREADQDTEEGYLQKKQIESDRLSTRKRKKRVDDEDKADVMDSFMTIGKRRKTTGRVVSTI